MGVFTRFFGFFLLVGLVFSCGEKKGGKGQENVVEETEKEQADIQKMAVRIEGMTCEIGCAKMIESKLSKTKGVTSVAVFFEKEEGEIAFDANLISKKAIISEINSIAGGELYKAFEDR